MYPKSDLGDAYIGDRHPLCRDMPPKAFLMRGAEYRYLGTNPLPALQYDPTAYDGSSTVRGLRPQCGPITPATLMHAPPVKSDPIVRGGAIIVSSLFFLVVPCKGAL